MLKQLLFVIAAFTLAGCAEMSSKSASTPDQAQASSTQCSAEEPLTGSRMRKRSCN
jgi:uncharacterized lipoprotein YajG